MINRRGFLGAILALGVAPAIVRSHALMPVRVVDGPVLWTIDQTRHAAGYLSQREQAHAAFSQWWADQFDQLAYARLAA
jgi:hypothetical protein